MNNTSLKERILNNSVIKDNAFVKTEINKLFSYFSQASQQIHISKNDLPYKQYLNNHFKSQIDLKKEISFYSHLWAITFHMITYLTETDINNYSIPHRFTLENILSRKEYQEFQ